MGSFGLALLLAKGAAESILISTGLSQWRVFSCSGPPYGPEARVGGQRSEVDGARNSFRRTRDRPKALTIVAEGIGLGRDNAKSASPRRGKPADTRATLW